MDDKSIALPTYQDSPPAYAAPQDATPRNTAPRPSATAIATAAAAPPPPPPLYKPKRTPSQEETYIRELKAWAAEKEKMNPGAYGEYFATVSDPTRASHDEWQQRHRAWEDGRGSSTEASSRYQRRGSDSGVPRRRDSVGAEEEGSGSRDGFLKRRMSSFMKRMGRHDGETTNGNADETVEPEGDDLGSGLPVANSRAELGTILEPHGTRSP